MQESMKRRLLDVQKQTPAANIVTDKLAQESRPLCISCSRRFARKDNVYCSRCSNRDLVNNLRDTLPTAPAPEEVVHTNTFSQPISTPFDFELVPTLIPPSKEEEDKWITEAAKKEDSSNVQAGNLSLFDEQPQGVVYTRAEVCKILNIGKTTLFRWEAKGLTPQPKRLMRNKQCMYNDAHIQLIREFMAKEYTPHVSYVPKEGVAALPFIQKKKKFTVARTNKRLERIVSTNLSRLPKGSIFK